MQEVKRRSSIDPKKACFKAVLLVMVWVLIISMVRDRGRIKKGFERKSLAEQRLVEEKRKNEALQKNLTMVMGLEYREKLIRDKLNMQKGNEVVVVLPEEVERKIDADEGMEEVMARPNWQKWWEIVAY